MRLASAIVPMIFISSCIAQQRPVLRSPVVELLSYAQYGQSERELNCLLIPYPCTVELCNVDRFFDFEGPWPSGAYCVLYDSSHVAFYSVTIKDGMKHGLERYFWANGTLMRQQQYINGIKTGSRFEFDASGKLEVIATFDHEGRFFSRYTFNEDYRSGSMHQVTDGVHISEGWKLIADSVIVTQNP